MLIDVGFNEYVVFMYEDSKHIKATNIQSTVIVSYYIILASK